jgi:hypothetical protein
MISLVRKTLDIYLREKRVITQSDFPTDISEYLTLRDAVFVTLYHEGRVIASSGRIACTKENSVFECIDNTLLCLKDTRFTTGLQTPESLDKIRVRVDMCSPTDRHILQSIDELDTSREGLILLSQNLGVISVVLPHMVHVDPKPAVYLALACQKSGLDITKLTPADYVLYGLKTRELTDMA